MGTFHPLVNQRRYSIKHAYDTIYTTNELNHFTLQVFYMHLWMNKSGTTNPTARVTLNPFTKIKKAVLLVFSQDSILYGLCIYLYIC